MEREWARLFTETATIEPPTGRDRYGATTYGTAVSYRAYCQPKVRMVRVKDGQQKVSNLRVRLINLDYSAPAFIDPDSRLTLPAGYAPQQPIILTAELSTDERGASHVILMV